MTKRKYEKPLYIEMPFEEALGRYAGTDPKELERPKKKTGDKKPPARTGSTSPDRKRQPDDES